MSVSSPSPERYAAVRALTDTLAAPLVPEDQTVQSMPDVSPTKWHRAHTTWFFEEFVLAPFAPAHRRVDPAYGYLFNSYYEAVGARHPRAERGLLSRPTVADVARYRSVVDHEMSSYLQGSPSEEALTLVELGLHHEQQHQELLLMDAKHVLSQGPLDPVYRDARRAAPTVVESLSWTEHDGGFLEVGFDGRGFAFDSEGPRHRVWLEPFALADRPVTCGEWSAFMDDGGYDRPELWLSEGWANVRAQGWRAPLYWRPADERGGSWTVFTLSGRRSVDGHEPVCHVSHYEADAFARWAGARLPTEAEWEVVATTQPVDESGCLDLDQLHPRAPAGSGLRQLFGGVWEWTASPYTAYPGFRPAAGAVGEYNGKFMSNQQVLRGGCCATPPGHLRPTYRNFFPAAARWAFSGVRLARGPHS